MALTRTVAVAAAAAAVVLTAPAVEAQPPSSGMTIVRQRRCQNSENCWDSDCKTAEYPESACIPAQSGHWIRLTCMQSAEGWDANVTMEHFTSGECEKETKTHEVPYYMYECLNLKGGSIAFTGCSSQG